MCVNEKTTAWKVFKIILKIKGLNIVKEICSESGG